MPPPVRPDVSIVTSGHDVADARLHRVCQSLLEAGLSVEVLGLGDPGMAPAGVTVRTRPRPGMAGRALLAMTWARSARGRLVVALDPDSLLAVLAVGRLRRIPVVADVHEDYLALLKDRAWAGGWRGRVGRLVATGAIRASSWADLVVVADDHIPPLSPGRRLVVKNLPQTALIPALSEPEAAPRALYVGDVRASRGLWAMVDAVGASAPWTLDVVGPVAPADQERARTVLEAAGRPDAVTFHGRQPPVVSWRLATGAWCGLALLADTAAFREAMPTKVYEYLACGLPIVVTDLPRLTQTLADTSAGAVVSSDPDAMGADVAEVLRRWASDADAYAAVRSAAIAAASDLRSGDAYATLARTLRELVSSDAGRA